MMLASRLGCLVAAGVLVTVATQSAARSHSPSANPHSSYSTSSPASLNSSSTVADNYDHDFYNITFTRILYFCEYLYSVRYGSYAGLTPTMFFRNSSVTVVGEESLVNLCLSLYGSNMCDKKPFISACLTDDVVFLHNHSCTKPSPDDAYFDLLLARTLLEEDEVCFGAVCSGEVRVVRLEVEGHTVHLFSPLTQHGACHKYLLPYYPTQDTPASLMFRNVHWPFCFPGYEVVWSLEHRSDGEGDGRGDGEVDVTKTWSFLPLHCRALEHLLVAMVGLMVVGGVAGNVLVLGVCAWKGHFTDPSMVLCVSLAAAELLVCVFVLSPALHAHLRLMHYAAAEEGPLLGAPRGQDVRRLLDVGVEEVLGGFLMFSAHVLNTGFAVALPTVLLLALEQSFALPGRSPQEELTRRRTRGFVAASWTVGVLLSLALVHGDGAFWYSFYKLPLSVPPGQMGLVLTGVAVILGVVVGVTVVVSFVAVWKTLKGGAVRCRLLLVLMTTILHMVTAGAGGAALLLPQGGTSSLRLEGARFLCWWGFLSSTCWHPWLLCLPRTDIRKAVMALVGGRHPWLERLLALGSWMSDAATPSPPPSPRPPPPYRHKLAPGRRHRFLPGVRYFK